MSGEVRAVFQSRTHVGKVRQENEDSHCDLPESGIWLVADGMGGHNNGRFASSTIVEQVRAELPGTGVAGSLEDRCSTLATAIFRANAHIHERGKATGQTGSTVVSLVLDGASFAVLWAGDSRAYLVREGRMIMLTRDHTLVEDMVEAGKLSPEEAASHSMKHVLSRAVGVKPELDLDAVPGTAQPGDVFVLCSDGLSGVVPEADIATMIAERGIAAADDLIAATLERGAPDNVTVTLVAVEADLAGEPAGELGDRE